MYNHFGEFPSLIRKRLPLTTNEYSLAGTYKLVVPMNVWIIWVTGCGSGGGGYTGGANKGSGGGGAEAVFWYPMYVTPGSTLRIVVAASVGANTDGIATTIDRKSTRLNS